MTPSNVIYIVGGNAQFNAKLNVCFEVIISD